MLLGLAPWGPPVPTLYLLMNTICRLPSSAGTDAIFSISMTNPSSHLSHFVSEEKEGQAEMGKPALGASCKRLPSAPISSTSPAQCLLLGYDVTNRTESSTGYVQT